ncbi:LDH2 family malate/lactate/ureidoglycolate dehydrogenase [Paucibacter oligotrophus]|uniref:LDH2 family malate/lactate/ureidoglycolate dehydrogenase n=1 Tax=Roseateles oligotrophus TaxID=1769250 RepID=A0A840LEX5_9BURK|nr:Ldh family oxidoreductase [Roseateles oligotrophus]MBB4846241.1 LDH2 family malate/lactate/ureidoglycolate dehydrogenase [Roseateles oligotrophus]
MLVPSFTAAQTSCRALEHVGVHMDSAALQVDLLLEADLRGRPSHGLMRLPRLVERICNGVLNPGATGQHQWRGNFLEVDGQNGLGPVVACSALDALAAASRQHGLALAAIRHNNHLGMLAWYAQRMAAQGLILIAASTSEALVHPWGGRRAMLGTNPLAIGIPIAGKPFILDMATSVVSMGQIHDHALRGQQIPAHWALDAQGQATTDAAAARQGSIAPFGEAKGYALGLALELLITCLAGSAIGTDVVGTLDSTQVCNKGDLFIVINPGERPDLARQLSGYLDAVRGSGGSDQTVSVPGDRAMQVRASNLESGITLADDVWRQIQRMAGRQTQSTEQQA